MERMLTVLALTLVLLLSGCTTFYQYHSEGEVVDSGGASHTAVLYWFGEEGRLWYGKKYMQLDSDVNVRICGVGAKVFDLSSRDRLEMPAKANDLRIVDLDPAGGLTEVDPPIRLGTGDYCGLILLDAQPVTTGELSVDQAPSVAVLCKSVRNPDRYPEPRIYRFDDIHRDETSTSDRSGPDPCLVTTEE